MDDEYEFLLKVGRVNHLPEFKRNKEIKTNLKFFMLSILLIFALYSMIYSEDLSLQTIEKKDDSITGYSVYEQESDDLEHYAFYEQNEHDILWNDLEANEFLIENDLVDYPTSAEKYNNNAFIYSQEQINPGLVAHYSFENNANDSSGRGHHGTLYSSSFDNGIIGNAVLLDGVYSYVSIPQSSDFQSPEITYSLWIKPMNDSDKTFIISQYMGWMLQYENGRLRPRIWFNDGGNRVETSNHVGNNLAINEWHHIAVTISSNGESRFYINGKLQSVVNVPREIWYGDVLSTILISRKGWWGGGQDTRFTGLVDEVKIFNYALDENEIRNLMNLLRNPSFEDGLESWTFAKSPLPSSGDWEIHEQDCYSGKCLKLTKGNSSTIYGRQIVGTLEPGRAYTFSAKFKTSTGN